MLFVLTKEEFQRALITGMNQVTAGFHVDVDKVTVFEFRVAENGIALDVAHGSATGKVGLQTEITVTGDPAKVAEKVAEVFSEAIPQAAATESNSDIELEADVVKGELQKVMERVPSIATIRTWSAEERGKAVRWAKRVQRKKPDAPMPERPDFIVEPKPRAPRGSRSEPEPDVAKPAAEARGRVPRVNPNVENVLTQPVDDSGAGVDYGD